MDETNSYPGNTLKVVALAGGVGGARLAQGLAAALPGEDLTVIVNIGDDFEHFGLKICPDLDTVCYTLAGQENPEFGWGRAGETRRALSVVQALGGPTWFSVGDLDLGLHLERTRRLRAGESLSAVTRDFCQALGITARVLPASDQAVPTLVHTREGVLGFQEYFVLRRCEPLVEAFTFLGVEGAAPAPGVISALHEADLVVICPSNPWVSVDPILAVAGIREELCRRPVIAVSPIIGGQTVKGPAAKMFAELGLRPSATAVARHYGSQNSTGLLSAFVLDRVDDNLQDAIQSQGIKVHSTDTIMKTPPDRLRLAQEVLQLGRKLVQADFQ
jgi:LPPG:FO 2-phospho-L-lactate transferase